MASDLGLDYDYQYKLLLIGNSGVGKSCILMRYAENVFTTHFFNTIGVDFWDTAGQDRFRTITSGYYRGAQGIMLVYDISDQDSFDNITVWLKEIEKYAQENVCKILIGNKSDLEKKRVISTESGAKFANELGIPFIEVSALNSTNVEDSFMKIVKNIYNKQDKEAISNTQTKKLTLETQYQTENAKEKGDCKC